MAEYTLKVQVDPSQLRTQLQAALGKVNMGKLFTGGGGASGGMGGAGFTPGQNQKMFDKMHKLLELQVKKAEMSERTQKKGWMGKFGPSIMKLAGITMGLAALRQIGTALIDSSPLLQAMAKIGNTAFTLFLRPFGDFIGFLLRPFLILMLKHAIHFYKLFGGANALAAVGTFTERLTGTNEEGEFDLGKWLTTVFAGGGNPLTGAIRQGIGDMLLTWVADIFDFKVPLPMFVGYRRKDEPTDEEKIEQAQEDARDEATKTDIRPWEQHAIDNPPTQEDIDLINDPDEYKKKWMEKFLGENDPATIENFANLDKKDKEEQKQLESAEQSTLNMIDMSAKFGAIKDLAEESLSQGADPAKNMMIQIARRYIAARNAGISASDAIINIADIFKQAEENIISRLRALAASKKSSGETSSSAKLAQQILSQGTDLLTPEGGFQSGIIDTGDRGKAIAKYRSTINAIIQYNAALGEGAYQKLYRNNEMSQLDDDTLKMLAGMGDSQMAGVLRGIGGFSLAQGGVINEPVVGRGLRSGRPYMLGEQGAETVTPGIGGSGGGDSFVAHFHITGVNPDQFETMVKPMVFRWLNELKSNRGIT